MLLTRPADRSNRLKLPAPCSWRRQIQTQRRRWALRHRLGSSSVVTPTATSYRRSRHRGRRRHRRPYCSAAAAPWVSRPRQNRLHHHHPARHRPAPQRPDPFASLLRKRVDWQWGQSRRPRPAASGRGSEASLAGSPSRCWQALPSYVCLAHPRTPHRPYQTGASRPVRSKGQSASHQTQSQPQQLSRCVCGRTFAHQGLLGWHLLMIREQTGRDG